MTDTPRKYVLVVEHGFWNQGDVRVRREGVWAYSAQEARDRFTSSGSEWRDGKYVASSRVIDVEPYRSENPEHVGLEFR